MTRAIGGVTLIKFMDQLIPTGFRAISDFPGYCVNSTGQVLSCLRLGKWKPMRPFSDKHKKGRVRYVLSKQGKLHHRLAHRLVLEAFVGPCPDGLEACHNDGNTFNNCVTNLRWDTHVSNMEDRDKHGRTVVGVRHPCSKLNEHLIRGIRELHEYGIEQTRIASLLGVPVWSVNGVCVGKTYKAVL